MAINPFPSIKCCNKRLAIIKFPVPAGRFDCNTEHLGHLLGDGSTFPSVLGLPCQAAPHQVLNGQHFHHSSPSRVSFFSPVSSALIRDQTAGEQLIPPVGLVCVHTFSLSCTLNMQL